MTYYEFFNNDIADFASVKNCITVTLLRGVQKYPLTFCKFNPESTGLFAPGTALGGVAHSFCKIRSGHPREL